MRIFFPSKRFPSVVVTNSPSSFILSKNKGGLKVNILSWEFDLGSSRKYFLFFMRCKDSKRIISFYFIFSSIVLTVPWASFIERTIYPFLAPDPDKASLLSVLNLTTFSFLSGFQRLPNSFLWLIIKWNFFSILKLWIQMPIKEIIFLFLASKL